MSAKTPIKAGSAYIELDAKNNKLIKGLKSAQKMLDGFGAAVTGIGVKMIAAGAAVAAPLTLAATHFMNAGDALEKMAARTGLSVEAVSQLSFAAGQSGTDIEAVEKAVRRMQTSLLDATRGMASAQEGFDDLGLSVAELSAMTPEEQFTAICAALNQIEDPTRRAAMAMKVFGKSGSMLLPMLSGMEDLRKEADYLGLTVSGKTAKSAADLNDAWGRLTAMFKMFIFDVGAALAPMLIDLADKAKLVMRTVLQWIKNNQSAIVSVAKITVGVIAAGTALVVVGGILKGFSLILGGVIAVVSAGLAIFKVAAAVVGFLVSPVGLVVTALAALTIGVLTASGAVGKATSWMGTKFEDLKSGAVETFQGIKDALSSGDIALAAKILWVSLKLAWYQGIEPLRKAWNWFTAGFRELWGATWWGIKEVYFNVVWGLKTAWDHFCRFFIDLWATVSGGVMTAWNEVLGFLIKSWVRVKGLFSDIDVNAEVKRIDRKTAQKNETVFRDVNEKLNQSGADMAQSKADRDAEFEANSKRNADQYEAAMIASQDAYTDNIAAITNELEELRAQRRALLQEARDKSDNTPDFPVANLPTVPELNTAIEARGATAGSFYADRLANITGTDDAKRTADGVGELVRQGRETNKLLKNQTKLVFT